MGTEIAEIRTFTNLPQDRVIHGEGAVARLRDEVVRLGSVGPRT